MIKDRVIVINVKKNWGKELYYPANPTAALICQLTGRKTLSKHDLQIAIELGFILRNEAVTIDLGGLAK